MSNNKIVELMQVQPKQRDVSWLQSSLQAAMNLESSTIPIYLCGYWSIQTDSAGTVTSLMQSIVWEEMLHMGIACNLLTALGVAPQIVSGYRNNIEPFPNRVAGRRTAEPATLSCGAQQGLCTERLHADRDAGASACWALTYPTIGAFYDAISQAFSSQNPTLSPTNQLSTKFNDLNMSMDVITTLDQALAAIEEIKEQGEGTDTSTTDSPYTQDYGNGAELSHYYKFSEIYYGATLIQQDKTGSIRGARYRGRSRYTLCSRSQLGDT